MLGWGPGQGEEHFVQRRSAQADVIDRLDRSSLLRQILGELGLQLKDAKTRIVHLEVGGEGLDFLGFHHRWVRANRARHVQFLARWPSRRAMQHASDRVREITARERLLLPVEDIVQDLNRYLRGWAGYFRYGNSARKFSHIDTYVNERLAILASAKHGLQGRNWATRFNYEWCTQLGVYRLTGTVRPTTAYASR